MHLIINMHSDTGSKSQTGFVDQNGVTVRANSFVYFTEELIEDAAKYGFEVQTVLVDFWNEEYQSLICPKAGFATGMDEARSGLITGCYDL